MKLRLTAVFYRSRDRKILRARAVVVKIFNGLILPSILVELVEWE